MKKLLLTACTIGFGLVNAQVIITENFDSYTLGNVGTVFTGNTPGQGGWTPWQGTAPDHQIVSIDAAHGNSLQLTSGNTGTAASHRIDFKDTTNSTALPANTIIQGTVQIYTGPPTTGKGKVGVQLFDYTLDPTNGTGLGGVWYDFGTKTVGGYAHLTNLSDPNLASAFYTITLGQTPPTYPANTWITLSFRYDTTTGVPTWITPHGTYTFTNANYAPTPGLLPEEINVVNIVGTQAPANTQFNTAAVDNIDIQFVDPATLGTTDIVKEATILSVYPNPAADILNISYNGKINSVEIFDATGKIIKSKLEGNSVNVSTLVPGVYTITVATEEGKIVERFIKK